MDKKWSQGDTNIFLVILLVIASFLIGSLWTRVSSTQKDNTANTTGTGKVTGVKASKFQECVDSGKYAKTVQDDTQGGQGAGISGTPGSILINVKTKQTRLIPGAYPFEEIKNQIDELLAGKPDSLPTPMPTVDFAKVPVVTDKDHTKGNKNADVVMIEYSDFECPFCKQFQPTVKQILDNYKDKILFVYRHYPLPFHANAQKEAEASECASEFGGNDGFWKYAEAIYERTSSNGTGFALSKLDPLALELGISK